MYYLINICIIYYKSVVNVLNKSVQVKENVKGTLRRKDYSEGSLINTIKHICQGKLVNCQTGCQEEQLKLYSIGNKEIL